MSGSIGPREAWKQVIYRANRPPRFLGQGNDLTPSRSKPANSPPAPVPPDEPPRSRFQRLAHHTAFVLSLLGAGVGAYWLYKDPPHNPPVVSTTPIPQPRHTEYRYGVLRHVSASEKQPAQWLFFHPFHGELLPLEPVAPDILSSWFGTGVNVVVVGRWASSSNQTAGNESVFSQEWIDPAQRVLQALEPPTYPGKETLRGVARYDRSRAVWTLVEPDSQRVVTLSSIQPEHLIHWVNQPVWVRARLEQQGPKNEQPARWQVLGLEFP